MEKKSDMGITTNFNPQDFRSKYQEALKVLIMGIEDVMDLAGLNAVSVARGNKPEGARDFTDRTNNLRSSIGYVLYKDGEKIRANFVTAGAGKEGDGANGVQTGSAYAEEVAKEYPKGFVLVLCAGMNYASYVEAKGFDVIASAGLSAKTELEKNFSSIIEEIKDKTKIDFQLIKK